MILAHVAQHAVTLHSVAASIPQPCRPSRGEACNTWPEEHKYWTYLFWTYLHAVRQPNVSFEWYTEVQEWAWVLVIAGGYFLGTIFTYRNHNRRGAATDPRGPQVQDLYPVESYNGYVTERNGGVDMFNYALIAAVVIYTAIVIVGNVINAQVY